MYLWRRKRLETFPRVPADVPLEPKSAGNVAKGAGECTLGAKKSGRSFRVSAAFPDYQGGLHKLLHRRRARKTGVLRLH